MGSGSIERNDYHTKRGFFTVKDTDTKLGGNFWFLVRPFFGFNDERFFYVKQLPGVDARYEITGEGYIFTKSQRKSLTRQLSELREELSGVTLYYYFINDEGRVFHKEKASESIKYAACRRSTSPPQRH